MNRGWLWRVAFVLLWLFVFTIPSEKSLEIPGVGSVSRLAGIVAFAGAAALLLVERKIRAPLPSHLALTAFLCWSAFTLYWSVQQAATLERIVTYAQLLALVWLVWQIARDAAQIDMLLSAYVLGCLPAIAGTIRGFRSAEAVYYQRYAGGGLDPNDLALTLALSLPMAFYLSLRRTGWQRWLFRAYLALAATAILLTASRAGTAAMAIAFTLPFLCWKTLPGGERKVLLAGTLLLAAVSASLVPAASWKRLATTFGEVERGTLNSRTLLWGAGWEAIQGRPLEGVGAGAYPESLVPYIGRPRDFTPVAHNTFVSVFVETGLIGFTLFVLFLFLTIRQLGSCPAVQRTAWRVCLVVWATGVSTLTWEHRKPTWFLFAAIMGHAAAATTWSRRVRIVSAQPVSETPRISGEPTCVSEHSRYSLT
jgi:O-antigen ligase